MPWLHVLDGGVDEHFQNPSVRRKGVNGRIGAFLRDFAQAVNEGDIGVLLQMEGEHVAVIDVADHVAVGENDVFLTGVVQETGDGREVFHAAVRDGACVTEGRQDEQALSLAGEIHALPEPRWSISD